jgi:hypothetical protein
MSAVSGDTDGVREQSVFDNLAAWVAHDPANLDLDEVVM